VWSVLKLAARAAIWRTTSEPKLVGLPTLLGYALVLAVFRVAFQYFVAGGPAGHFNPYGLNAVIAWLAVELAVAAFFVSPAGRATALAAMFILSIIADIVTLAVEFASPLLASAAGLDVLRTRAVVAPVIFAVEIVWWLGAMSRVIGSLEPARRLRLLARVAALWVALFAAHALIPDAPVFVPRDFDVRTANWWEYLYASYSATAEAARSQPRLLQAEVDKLAPPRKGSTNIYVIGLAGWADQDVFLKEIDGSLAALANVLPVKDRMLRLINNRETISKVPLASAGNFAAAVHAIAGIMAKDEDVLILVMTSHGERTGFALQFPGVPSAELTPKDVAATLDTEGIKNRVVVVSACFAGIFVSPLQNDNTIVMTASDDKSTSFGCAPEREWTYFGDALFHQSLQRGTDFEQAFDHARVLIQGWELMDHIPSSNPQAYFGPALVAKLAPLFQAAPEGH
jgi:hypothetical protein